MKPPNNRKHDEKNLAVFRIASCLFILFLTAFAFGQNSNPDLSAIIQNAAKQTDNYREAFKNLLSEETKTFEIFDKNGAVKKRTVVESNFMIFQSLKDETISNEYRSVIKVDGKAVGKRTDLAEVLSKAKSLKEELEKIRKENSRYDKTLEINGLTLSQALILEGTFSPYFEFRIARREADVYEIEYRQAKVSPYILFGAASTDERQRAIKYDLDLPKSVDKEKVLLRGKLWIDANTFQVRREEREVTGNVKNSSDRIVFFREEYEYQSSDFEILVPKKIVYTYFKIKTDDENASVSTVPEVRATFEYAKFRKSRVDIKILDDEN